jgi:hypothetical protein
MVFVRIFPAFSVLTLFYSPDTKNQGFFVKFTIESINYRLNQPFFEEKCLKSIHKLQGDSIQKIRIQLT